MSPVEELCPVGVIGAGTMGAGIAQIAAQAGHRVLLFDAFKGAAQKGKTRLLAGLEKLAERGKFDRSEIDAIASRLTVVESLSGLSDAGLVVEAIVEDLPVKRKLFEELEGIVGPETILATNTSSISVTSIARNLANPARLVGMHFFNPVPVMKLVEVISGVATSRQVAESIFNTARTWGKTPVHVKSTPGFIVNRVARAYYAEALRLYEEQVADPATLDALLTEGAGFRMGPFELMDLIGHDVNYAVSLSVFNAFYQEPRFRPSHVQEELVNAGHLGRKSGRGFYDYHEGAQKPDVRSEAADENMDELDGLVPGEDYAVAGCNIVQTDGRTAHARAHELKQPALVYDLVSRDGPRRIAFAASDDMPAAVIGSFIRTMALRGIAVTRLPDWPGLVCMRILALLANEAFEARLQGVATEADIDAAMRFGVNYPRGPMEWARQIGLDVILSVLDTLHELTGDPRYRASLALRLAANH